MAKKKKKLPSYQEEKLIAEFEPKTKKQEEFINLIKSKEVIICKGISGSGKTFISLGTALQMLGGKYKQIILVKSLTTVPEEEMGYLKGSVDQKMYPYIMNFTWNIDKLCGYGAAKDLLDKGIIRVMPIAFVRGITFDNSIVIIDEAQNLSFHTFKTLVTRIGEDSKYIIMGDVEQIDRRNKNESPLEKICEIFEDSETVGTIEFKNEDCVRNPIIPELLSKLREHEI